MRPEDPFDRPVQVLSARYGARIDPCDVRLSDVLAALDDETREAMARRVADQFEMDEGEPYLGSRHARVGWGRAIVAALCDREESPDE